MARPDPIVGNIADLVAFWVPFFGAPKGPLKIKQTLVKPVGGDGMIREVERPGSGGIEAVLPGDAYEAPDQRAKVCIKDLEGEYGRPGRAKEFGAKIEAVCKAKVKVPVPRRA